MHLFDLVCVTNQFVWGDLNFTTLCFYDYETFVPDSNE